MARQYSPDEIGALLHDAQRDATRPRGATVADVRAGLLRALLFGAGAFLLVGALLYWMAAPFDVLLQSSLLAGVLTLGTALLLLAMPRDHMAYLRRVQQAQRLVNEAVFRKEEAYRRILALEAEHDAARAEWQRALAELRHENKALRSDLLRAQEARRTPTFTPRADVAAETVKDATTILEHWFATLRTDARGNTRGEWLSRPKAMQSGWTKTRHEGAAQLLLDAGITGLNEKLPFVKAEYATADAALYRLHTFCREAAAEPDMPRRAAYVESENG